MTDTSADRPVRLTLGRLLLPRNDATASPSRTAARATSTRPGRAAGVALGALLVLTAALYLWNLSASGWANSFYSAAVQAGSQSWKAFLFGSSDAANSITVDKTPLALWPMALSVRIFGLNSWAILVPQALMGVASVWLLNLSVRRATGNVWAGLGAGLILAVTPVATLMFRFNNPDAALVLLLIAAVYATQRALDTPERAVRWIALAGALVGLAFLAKMLQAFLVLPALGGAYLLCAAVPMARRLGHLVVAFAAMLLAGGWWVALAELWPADSRPWIGGSQNNSVLELAFGYNGLGRLNGNETGSVGTNGNWGETGIGRLFNSEVGGQIAWLLPAALVLLVVASIWTWRTSSRTDRRVTGLVVWGGWLLITWLTFSFMAGIFHAYYTVALAPAIAAVVGIGAAVLWEHRDNDLAAITAGGVIVMTSAMAFILLSRSSGFLPWLRWLIVIVGLSSAVFVAMGRHLTRTQFRAAAAMAVIAALAGPFAYSVQTAATAHTGSIVTAGPSTGGGFGGGGGGGRPPQQQGGGGQQTGTGGMGGIGNLLNGSNPSDTLTQLLRQDSDRFTWVAATVGSNSAAGYQLATGSPVMAIGGFNGTDPSPTLAQFKAWVKTGRIHYFIGGSTGSSTGTATSISEWVSGHFSSQTVDGVTIYDLNTTTEGAN